MKRESTVNKKKNNANEEVNKQNKKILETGEKEGKKTMISAKR